MASTFSLWSVTLFLIIWFKKRNNAQIRSMYVYFKNTQIFSTSGRRKSVITKTFIVSLNSQNSHTGSHQLVTIFPTENTSNQNSQDEAASLIKPYPYNGALTMEMQMSPFQKSSALIKLPCAWVLSCFSPF